MFHYMALNKFEIIDKDQMWQKDKCRTGFEPKYLLSDLLAFEIAIYFIYLDCERIHFLI